MIEGTYRVGHQEQLYIENQAMIAVPREDGGVTVHGSLQCPYYIHKAMKRALNMGDELAVVVQAETGGGFGGKEEYPSDHRPPRGAARPEVPQAGAHDLRPPRGHQRDHQAPSGGRSLPLAASSATGELVAQEIEVIMDGGAYCTLTPVVLSRGVLHAGGPYRCENVRITGRAMATNTPPNGAFRGFGAPQTEFAAEMQINRIAEALDASPARPAPALGLPRGRRHADRPGAARGVGGIEVLEAAAPRHRRSIARTPRRAPSARARTDGARLASGIGLALAWHGAGFTGSGEVKLASVAVARADR